MEVEVKLRLPDSAAHQKLSDLLSPFHVQTHFQENLFFDGANCELASVRAVLRLRFYGGDSRCVLSLKSRPAIAAGISRAEELEEPLDPALGRAWAADPRRFLSLESSEALRRVRDEHGVSEDRGGLVCLGGFRNVRSVYDWEGLRLELDETMFDFGTNYELECESSEPERDKVLLERLLDSNGIGFSYSKLSKFDIFRSRKLPE